MTTAEYLSLGISLFAALGAILTAISTARRLRSQNKLDEASAAEKISAAAGGIVDDLRATIEDLRRKERDLAEKTEALEAGLVALRIERDQLVLRVGSMEHELEKFRRGVGLLVGQIRSLGHSPVWEPEKIPPASPAVSP